MRFVFNPAVIPLLQVNPLLGALLEQRAESVAEEARRIAPYETGAYRDEIEADSGIENGRFIGRVNANDPASGYIEWGTVDTPTFAVLRRSLGV